MLLTEACKYNGNSCVLKACFILCLILRSDTVPAASTEQIPLICMEKYEEKDLWHLYQTKRSANLCETGGVTAFSYEVVKMFKKTNTQRFIYFSNREN